MAVPDFQSMMLPLVQIAADGHEHTMAEALDTLAAGFKLSEADLAERLPSGLQRTFVNRANWAATYLRKAVVIESTGRARFRITHRGLELLAESPSRISVALLRRYPEFLAFTAVSPAVDAKPGPVPVEETVKTPLEVLEGTHQQLQQSLAGDLIDRVKAVTPRFFEQLVIDVLVKMGYGGSREEAARAVGKSGDEGIDGVINQDRLGLDVVYVQAKRWEGTVGRREVQMFAGSLEGQRASKGVFITTSNFTAEAKAYVKTIGKKIILIDGPMLADLMIEHSVGVAATATYVVKRLDTDYFENA
jgi:restriction system protein